MPRPRPARARPFALVAIPLSVAACAGEIGEPLGQEGAHEHGVADVGMIVDGASATVVFTAPAGDLWGFERPPETSEEVDARSAALTLLEEGFVQALGLDPVLGCRVTGAEWSGAAAVTERDADPAVANDVDAHDHHAGGSDAVGAFEVECERPIRGSRLRLTFSDLFEALERIDLQVVSEDRQFGRRVDASGTQVDL